MNDDVQREFNMKKGQLCVVCGVRLATTMDHLPPKSLYHQPRPSNLHTVPACRDCNGGHSEADEDFKFFVLADTSLESPERTKVVEHILRTVKHNRSIKKRIGASKEVALRLRNGSVEKARMFQYSAHYYKASMKRIVRGFYWRETGKILSPTVNIEIHPNRTIHLELRTFLREVLDGVNPQFLNARTVGYRWYESEDGVIVWEFCYFNSHVVYAVVDCVPT